MIILKIKIILIILMVLKIVCVSGLYLYPCLIVLYCMFLLSPAHSKYTKCECKNRYVRSTGRPRAICGQRSPLTCFAWLWIRVWGSRMNGRTHKSPPVFHRTSYPFGPLPKKASWFWRFRKSSLGTYSLSVWIPYSNSIIFTLIAGL